MSTLAAWSVPHHSHTSTLTRAEALMSSCAHLDRSQSGNVVDTRPQSPGGTSEKHLGISSPAVGLCFREQNRELVALHRLTPEDQPLVFLVTQLQVRSQKRDVPARAVRQRLLLGEVDDQLTRIGIDNRHHALLLERFREMLLDDRKRADEDRAERCHIVLFDFQQSRQISYSLPI